MGQPIKGFGLDILNIPDELKENMEWAVSTMKVLDVQSGRKDKSPRNPKTGERISVTSSEGWTDFDTAANAGYPAIGMRMKESDPYVVIDIDETKDSDLKEFSKKVCMTFDTYMERSKSKKGIHIILKGPNEAGRRRNNIEVYSRDRYIICTGNVIRNKDITDGGKPLASLRKSLSPHENPDIIPIIEDQEAKESDTQVLKRMFDAVNGAEVRELYNTVPGPNDDWSKLDAQLASHLCFYTRNKEQAVRIFRKSKLYRGSGNVKKSGYTDRNKYEQEYLLRRTFAKAWAMIDREEKSSQINDEEFQKLIERNKLNSKPVSVDIDDQSLDIPEHESFLPPISVPSGLVGQVAKYIYNTAPRPVWEVAVSGALAFLSGITGRQYNINGSGLGLYITLLAKTGRGKEAANSGISNLMDEVSKVIPSVHMFRGPSHIASGQGLIRSMADTESDDNIPSKMIILSEFGHTLNIITAKDATSADMRTRQALLDFFSKNSWGSLIKETAYSDKQNNTKSIKSANLTILGDTTPDMFFKAVNLDIINEGFLPRFLIVEYDGPRVKANYNINRIPPSDLVVRVQNLIHQVITMRDLDQVINIIINEDAQEILEEFDNYCDEKINQEDASAEMWNRAHLIALRIAGVVATGNNPFEPRVEKEDAQWAIDIVKRSVLSIQHRIMTGEFGSGDLHLQSDVRRQIHRYFENDMHKLEGSKGNVIYPKFGVMPMRYLNKTCGRRASFLNSSRGSDATLNSIVLSLIAQGDLIEMNTKELQAELLSSDGDKVNVDKRALRVDRCFSKGPNYESNWEEERSLEQ